MRGPGTFYLISGALMIWTAFASTAYLIWHIMMLTGGDKIWIAEPNPYLLYLEVVGLSLLGINAVVFLVLTIIKVKRYLKEVNHDNRRL